MQDKLIQHLEYAVTVFGGRKELADAAGRKPASVSEWLTGKHKPDLVALMNMDAAARKRRLKIRFDPRELRPELF